MKRFVIDGTFNIDGLILQEAEIPRPGPGQVLVRIKAASLNYRDLLMVSGAYSRTIPQPLIPLSDAAGEVVELGEGANGWKIGDRVIPTFFQNWPAGAITSRVPGSALGGALQGVLTEYALFDPQGLVAMPEHLSYEEAAALPCAAVTAWHCMQAAQLRCGKTMLTMGSGGVSCFALQFAKAAGARVIATSGSDAKGERLSALGAAAVINYREDSAWDRQVVDLTGGEGVDAVVEVGGAGTLPLSIKATRPGGHISLVGVLAGQRGEFNPLPAVMKGISIHGIFVGSREMFLDMNRAMSLHDIHPVIDRVFSFEESRDAFRHLESGAHVGKVIIAVP